MAHTAEAASCWAAAASAAAAASFGMQQQPQQFGPLSRANLAPPPPPPQQLQQQMQQMQSNLQQMPVKQDTDGDVDMQQDSNTSEQGEQPRPAWMKSKLPGVRKISKKEKRRRQNEHLRRLLVPKNALMVLNEMMLHEQVTNVSNQFKVEPAENAPFFKSQNKHTFRADLTLDGQNYKGYGENKLTARNAAAEQAIRDLIIKRLSKSYVSDDGSQSSENDEETLPMIQIASFALHKLFSEWEYEGHKVPQLRPPAASVSTSEAEGEAAPRAAVKKPKELPLNAAAMHPCMLLTYMRPAMEYRELAVEGDRPQNMTFTMGVEVDGSTYVGKASNKKEARKAAAKAACQALFGVKFDEVPSANAPVVAPQPE